MKTLLLAAGLLMTGASVYGIVDYNKKANAKEFKELYKEKSAPVETPKEAIVPPPAAEAKSAKTEVPVKAVTTETKEKKKKAKKQRVFYLKEFSRSRLG